MTCEEFFELYVASNNEFDGLIDKMYWEQSFNSEELFDFLLTLAQIKDIELSDENTFDYDTFFWNVYKNSEKGLS